VIVDTSALVAAFRREDGHPLIVTALFTEPGYILTPVLVEFHRVTALDHNVIDPDAEEMIDRLTAQSIEILDFGRDAALAAVRANAAFGSGGGHGGKLNMLDLMVYGAAKVSGRPILCTGKDFTATDAAIHPASRRW
jgi:ribonuclease VapC